MFLFYAQLRHFLGGTEEIHENLSQDSWCSGRNLTPETPEADVGSLTIQPQISIVLVFKLVHTFRDILSVCFLKQYARYSREVQVVNRSV
jgi:hypothetical protein